MLLDVFEWGVCDVQQTLDRGSQRVEGRVHVETWVFVRDELRKMAVLRRHEAEYDAGKMRFRRRSAKQDMFGRCKTSIGRE